MIRNFEDYTHSLTEDEAKYIIPMLLKILALSIGKENAVKNQFILNNINSSLLEYCTANDIPAIRTRPARIRHMIHILRVSDTIPFLVATAVGYFISNDKKEIEDYMQSVDDRLRSIYQIRRALKRQMREWGKPAEAIQGQLIF